MEKEPVAREVDVALADIYHSARSTGSMTHAEAVDAVTAAVERDSALLKSVHDMFLIHERHKKIEFTNVRMCRVAGDAFEKTLRAAGFTMKVGDVWSKSEKPKHRRIVAVEPAETMMFAVDNITHGKSAGVMYVSADYTFIHKDSGVKYKKTMWWTISGASHADAVVALIKQMEHRDPEKKLGIGEPFVALDSGEEGSPDELHLSPHMCFPDEAFPVLSFGRDHTDTLNCDPDSVVRGCNGAPALQWIRGDVDEPTVLFEVPLPARMLVCAMLCFK